MRISFSYIFLFILLSCSKSDQAKPPILNAFTFTQTDTTGIDHVYSDTAKLNPDGTYDYVINGKVTVVQPVAFIWQPELNDINKFQFYFISANSFGTLTLFFSMPYFQASRSGTNGMYPESLISLPGVADLAHYTISTNISDSTDGYVTGSFDISATTLDSGRTRITGIFKNLPTNFHP